MSKTKIKKSEEPAEAYPTVYDVEGLPSAYVVYDIRKISQKRKDSLIQEMQMKHAELKAAADNAPTGEGSCP